jgi:cell division protein FtsN
VQVIALGEEEISRSGEATTLAYQDLSTGEFYVQIGAFAEAANAVKLQRRFTSSGHSAIIQEGFEGDSTINRVQVYAGKTIQNAKRAEQALLERGWTGAFIVAR